MLQNNERQSFIEKSHSTQRPGHWGTHGDFLKEVTSLQVLTKEIKYTAQSMTIDLSIRKPRKIGQPGSSSVNPL